VNVLMTIVESHASRDDTGAMVHLYIAAVGDALTMSFQLCLPRSCSQESNSMINESNNFLLPPVVQSRKLTAFMVRSVNGLIVHAQSNSNVIPALQQAIDEIMTRTLFHFFRRSEVQNSKYRKINDDLSDMVGRLLSSTHESVRSIAAACLQNSLRIHAAPLIGTEMCEAVISEFLSSSQARSGYQRKKKILSCWCKLSSI